MRKMTRCRRNLRNGPTRLRRPGAFWRARDSAVAIIIAIMLLPMIVAAGGALDVARLYIAKTRLIFALDTAALAAGSAYDISDSSVGETAFQKFFDANYPSSKVGTVTPVTLVPNITSSQVDVTATVTVDTLFLRVMGIPTLSATVTSVIRRHTTGLELALVLDNTYSMVQNGLMDPLKTAVGQLLDTIFDGEATPEGIRVGIVPYVAAVNIGTDNSAYVQADPGNEYPADDGLNPADPIVDTAWKGCVRARPAPYDTTDDFLAGDASQGEWPRYFWEAEHYYWRDNLVGSSAFQCANRWWRKLDGIVPPLPRQSGLYSDPSFDSATPPDGPGSFRDAADVALTSVTPPDTTGPNKACPTPITPLTNDRAALDAAIAAMEGWQGGGTIINTGAAWGWRVLSPGEPFTEGAVYTDANVNKVMVLMTDGRNEFASQVAPCWNSGVPAALLGNPNPRYNSHYSAYGYVSEGTLGTTTSLNDAATELNARLATLCTNIKGASAAGITIYTIVFGMDSSSIWDTVKARMQACATSAAHFFDAPTAADLDAAFAAIGAELRKLRVAQ
jgi:Flp pilus assembly protein TadG